MASSLTLMLSIAFMTCFTLVATTSDPAAHICANVCEDEIAMADQCELSSGCDVMTQNRGQYRSCSRGCWRQQAICYRYCTRAFMRVVTRCNQTCQDDQDVECPFNCMSLRLHEGKQRMYRRRNQVSSQPGRRNRRDSEEIQESD